jgi:tryptophanyl-tRNA synthetase
MSKKILLSGVKPTGRPHIGNYFGAMKQFVELQNDHQCLFMIADYHALNTIQNKDEMLENILGVALDYLAIGLDPEKSVIFKQSDVPEHTELCWIFDTITTMPYLMRAHAFKDAEAKNKEISVGTFNYPLLMASDILLYDTEVVPVGQDQKQHIEISRDTAQKFNNQFGGETFKLPEELIIDDVAIVPGTDGQKMSKSYKNTIPLFASDEEIEKAVMGIVTDSSGETPLNVYSMHSLIKPRPELNRLYEEHKGKYKVLKEALIADLKAFIGPMRERREQLAQDMDKVKEILLIGGKKARSRASEKMKEVREKIGISIY